VLSRWLPAVALPTHATRRRELTRLRTPLRYASPSHSRTRSSRIGSAAQRAGAPVNTAWRRQQRGRSLVEFYQNIQDGPPDEGGGVERGGGGLVTDREPRRLRCHSVRLHHYSRSPVCRVDASAGKPKNFSLDRLLQSSRIISGLSLPLRAFGQLHICLLPTGPL
jgi:hypothetical protein